MIRSRRSSEPERGVRHRIGVTLRRPGIVVPAVVAGSVLSWLGTGWATLPDVSSLAEAWPDTTGYMRIRIAHAVRRADTLRIGDHPVRLSDVPAALRRAVLVSEDAGFYDHSGFDWHEI